jgi:NAD(P)-dependent dehydrogenase (short-subunit alcohol dehydrogenase family)
VVKCDLEDLVSVAAAAKEVLALGLPLHTLMLNAGVMIPPFTLTKQGLELQIGVNHVAHALLVRHLLPHLVATARYVVQCGMMAFQL